MGQTLKVDIKINKNNLDKASPVMKAAIRTALDKFSLDVDAHATSIVPVDTGELKSSLVEEMGDTHLTMTWEAPYAAYVEYGTSRMEAQPFVTPAVEAAEPGLQAAIKEIEAKLGG